MKRRLIRLYAKALLSRLDYLKLACSTEAGRAMFGSDDFEVIGNGIDIESFRFSIEKRKWFRREYGIPENAFVVGHVGRAGKDKNHLFLIKAFSEVLRMKGNAVLLLVGAVENSREVQGLIDRFGIRDRCVMTGALTSTSQCYSAMDVFLFPSFYEGFSVSLIEAQASGLECVVSDRISREHAISDRIRFIPISDAANAARVVCETEGNCTGARAETAIDDRYDAKQVANKMYRFYLEHQR